MARTIDQRNFRTTDISAGTADTGIDTLDTGTEAADSSTIARYVLGGTTTTRRLKPGAASTADRVVPAVDTEAAGQGWRENPAINASEAIEFGAQTWTVTLRVRRSGQALELDQNSDTTVIIYRVSSSGAHIAELGRATVRFTWTTTATDRAFDISVPQTTFAANDRLQVEIYVVTLSGVDIPAAPAVTTDLILEVGASTTSRVSSLTYDIRYARSTADIAPGTDAIIRRMTLFRSLADSAPATDSLTRQVTFPRAPSDSAPATDSLTRAMTLARALADSAPVTDSLERQITYGRTLRENIGATYVDVVDIPNKQITGQVRDRSGVPVVGAIVKLVRQIDDRVARETTSDINGNYDFIRDFSDTEQYYVVAYLPGSEPQLHGVSDRDLTAVPI